MNVAMTTDEVEAVRDTVRNHKRTPEDDRTTNARLRSIVDRIERLNTDRDEISSDVKDIYTEAKSAGFDTKVLRRLIAERKKDPADLEEMENLLDLYRREIGI